jgi:hypothetical protein
MNRKFAIAEHANVIGVQGLDGAVDEPTDLTLLVPSPFLWKAEGKRPDYLRWSWNPATGDLTIGTVHRHRDHIPASKVYPFAAWVRGFYFTKEGLIAVRTFHWPRGTYDDLDSDADRQVCLAASMHICRSLLASGQAGRRTPRIVLNVDNRWLEQRFRKYATSW